MPKRIVSVIMLTLLLASMLTLTIDIQPVKALTTIHIRADGSIDPPTEPISTSDNVTYTFTGNIYFKSIVVERSNIIINGNLRTIQGDGNGRGFSLSSINNVTIKNTNIKSFASGIFFSSSSNNKITGNIITLNDNGIEITDSSGNNITGNSITSNDGAGIIFVNTSNNIISGNNMSSNNYGIYLHSSSNTNNVTGNTVTTSEYHGIILDSSSNDSISGNNITANNNGIAIIDSSNNTLRNNAMAGNKYNFDVWGLTLEHFVNDVDVSNTVNGKPVYYWINETDATVPLDAGYVALINCTRITAQDLNLISNGEGMLLAYTMESNITRNNMTNNYFGIRLRDSSDNYIYHNSFVNNTNQIGAYDSVCVWDDDYPSGGNYWDDYSGMDWFRGVYQNETGSDGIVDTKYVINIDNRDNYPLTKPYGGLHDLGITDIAVSDEVIGQGYNVTIITKIINYGFSAEIFNVTVYADTPPIFAITNITLPSRNSTTITSTWNTTGFVKGNYTISAVADTVPGETDTSDNLFVNGWVFVLSLEHDVAIRSLASRPIVGKEYTSPINVTVMNVGNYTEDFNVTVSINTIPLLSQNVTLESGASTTIIFTWNTSGFSIGNYTISAVAEQVLGETDTSDNGPLDRLILVTKVGDLGGGYPPQFFKCDGRVDGYDLALFIQCYKHLAGNAQYLGDLGGLVNYVPAFFACDGKVDAFDLALFIQCYKGLGPS